MVGPISGNTGATDANTPPAISFDTPVTDIIRPAGKFEFISNTIAANKPRLTAMGALKAIGDARNANIVEQFKGEAQRAELRKEAYAAFADAALTNSQRAQALIAAGNAQLALAVDTDDYFDSIAVTVAVENSQVPNENTQVNDLNNAMNNWNAAKATYEGNPTPANLTALQNATTAYTTARNTYESFRATRNSQIAAYNAAVQATQNDLDSPGGINERLQELNDLRAILGLANVQPPSYELIRPDMEPAPATPDVSNPNNLPADLVNLAARSLVNITPISIDQAIQDFTNQLILAINLLLTETKIGTALADQSADVYDFIAFNLKERPNPTVLEAVIQDKPNVSPTDSTDVTAASGPGQSAIAAALVTTPGNVALREAPGQALYTAEKANESLANSPSQFSAVDERVRTDINGVSYTLLRDIKLNASIQARETLGPGSNLNNPALRAVSGLETINGIQGLLASGGVEKIVDGIISRSYSNNPELAEAVRAPLTAAIKAQFEFIAASELAEALGDPSISGLLLLATPGLEQLRSLLAGSSTLTVADLLSGPFNQIYLKVNLADRLREEGDMDSNEAAAEASVIVEQLDQDALQTLDEFKKALLNALLRSFGGTVANKIVDGILTQIGNDRDALALTREIIIAAEQQEAIVNQITSDTAEQAALLNALSANYRTAQELKDIAAEKLTAAAVSNERANALAEQVGRVALLNSVVQEQLEARLKQLGPEERKRIESEFISTITVPQKVKVEEKENRINPLSIPNQIADQIALLNDRGANNVIDAIVDDAKRAAREDYGDFVQRKRAQDLGRLYLHQTMEAGGPYTDTSALPKSNFAKPAASLPPTQAV